MTKVQMKHLAEAEQALTDLGKLSLPVALMYRVFKMRRQVRESLDLARELGEQILQQCGRPDKHGNLRVTQGGENWDSYQKLVAEVMHQEVQIDGRLTLQELAAEFDKNPPEGYANILFGLGPLLEDSGSAA